MIPDSAADTASTRPDGSRPGNTGSDSTRSETASTLFANAISSLGRLVRGELQLARAEIGQSIGAAKASLVKGIAAAILALVGINVLAGAAVAGLAASGIGAAPAGLIVAIALFGLALALGLSARAGLRRGSIVPRRSLGGLGRDAAAIAAALATKGPRNV